MNPLALLLALFVTALPNAWAAEPRVRVESAGPGTETEIALPLHKSRVIRADRQIADVMLASPEIAEVMALSDRSIYVIGRKVGSTSLVLYGPGRQLISVVELSVTPDLPTLRRRLHEVMPGERIEVRGANEAVVLSGAVSSGANLKQALALAETFAPGKVTNMMTLSGAQQVMLAVRFAEVQRNAAKELGINSSFDWAAGDDAVTAMTGVAPNLTPFGLVRGLNVTGNWTMDILLNALEQKGVVKVLAEPNLIALSGETASFLAGGEFPIPVGRERDNDSDTITIEFKEFGVKLGFTPTVIGNEAINLVVRPEVSAIDRANGITLDGLLIPGLTVRRAQTTVDLRHGESFAIAGLIRSTFSDDISQFPGLGDIPIIGALFRSAAFQREETELVIIVTPYLVRPANLTELRLPTDTFRPPTDAELFLGGWANGGGTALPAQQSAMPPGAGFSGPVGYVVK